MNVLCLGIDYIKQCRTDIDRLIEQSPPIPPEILTIFDKTHLQDISNTTVVSVPPILKLEPVDIFRTEIDEKRRIKQLMEMKELERKQRERMIKEEQDKIENAIKAHEKRRQSMRGEVELESIAKRLQQEKKSEEDKETVKHNLTLSSLTKELVNSKIY